MMVERLRDRFPLSAKDRKEIANEIERLRAVEKELKDLKELAKELYEHLEYCGWGDSYEREGARDLMVKTARMLH